MISISHWGMFDAPEPVTDAMLVCHNIVAQEVRRINQKLQQQLQIQGHLDSMDTDGRHKWLGLFGIACVCKECLNEE